MKPSTKARTTKRAPAKPKPARKPAPTPTANPKPDETGSDAALRPPAQPEVVTQPAPPAPEVVPPPPPAPPAEPEAATIAEPETVQVGDVSCVALRVPIGDVLGLLGQSVLDRVDALKGMASTSALAERMRASDGRCAPVYMTYEEGSAPTFNHGAEAVSAAIGLGDNDIFVVLVPSEEAETLQDHLVMVHREEQAKAAKG